MKNLIASLDKAIKRRMRIYKCDDPEEMEKIENFRKLYNRLKPLKLVALFLYMVLPFLEKPGWCIDNDEIDTNDAYGYWYCQNADRTISNSNIPKLPCNVTNSLLILTLIILFWFTKARDVYRKRDETGDTVVLQLWLIGIGMFDIFSVIIGTNINWSHDARKSFFVKCILFPYINAFIRPVLFTLQVR